MEIILIIKNINKAINLINKINSINTNIRVYKILTNLFDCLNIINNHSIYTVIIDYEIFKKISITDFSKLESSINYLIIVSDEMTLPKQGKCVFSTEEKIIENIYKIAKNKINNENNIKNFILEELKYLGYNPSYNGTKYLIECIYYIYINYSIYDDTSYAEVYSIIAKKYNKSVNTLKCNISRATSIMFCESEEAKLKSYLAICTLPKTGYRIIIQTILNKLNNHF